MKLSTPALDAFDRVVGDTWLKDLSTDVALYDVDLAYDRNSNITLADDHVHGGFDVEYELDDLDRLVRATEGTWNGSSITSTSREQDWTLSPTGNWDHTRLDLDGDGTYTATDGARRRQHLTCRFDGSKCPGLVS